MADKSAALRTHGELRIAVLRVSSALLLLLVLLLGATRAQASREPVTAWTTPAPVAFGVRVIPHRQREVTVSWALRATSGGARVILYAGTSVGPGTPLAEADIVRGLNEFRIVDRSGHDGRWLYWLVVVDDGGRQTVLGTLVCVSPAMSEGVPPTPPSAIHAYALLAEWSGTDPVVHWWEACDEPIAARDLFRQAPVVPPPRTHPTL